MAERALRELLDQHRTHLDRATDELGGFEVERRVVQNLVALAALGILAEQVDVGVRGVAEFLLLLMRFRLLALDVAAELLERSAQAVVLALGFGGRAVERELGHDGRHLVVALRAQVIRTQ